MRLGDTQSEADKAGEVSTDVFLLDEQRVPRCGSTGAACWEAGHFINNTGLPIWAV
jgi:hypothetical protein